MEVDECTLRQVVKIIDATIVITRDKIIWQSIATSQLGDSAEEVFRKAQTHAAFLMETEIQLAEIKQTRNLFALMLERALKGESIQPPIDRIN